MELSVEITTYERKQVLRDVLERLAGGTLAADRFEVVLSDDGSRDGLLEMADAMSHQLPYELRILRHEHRGPGYAHNAGIRACRADLVLMLAADVLPSPDLLKEHLRSHRAHPEPEVMVAGPLRQSPALPDTAFQRAHDARVQAVLSNESSWSPHGGFLVSNLSFKRSFMLRHGLFREWPPASGEDLELAHRLRGAGMRLVVAAGALGDHHHPETPRSLARRSYTRGYRSHYLADIRDEAVSAALEARERWGPRRLARVLLSNRWTIALAVDPTIALVERCPPLHPLMPILHRRLYVHHYDRGRRDHARGKPFDPFRGDA